jgi:hypothetical protein
VKTDWLAASRYERTHEILSAINLLSIHAKLTLAGIDDPASDIEVQQAREHLLAFLSRIEAVLKKAEQEHGAVVGTDPQLGELALRFLAGRPGGSRRSRSPGLPLATLADLVRSERPDDLEALVPFLERLRALVEEQTHTDVVTIPGDMEK